MYSNIKFPPFQRARVTTRRDGASTLTFPRMIPAILTGIGILALSPAAQAVGLTTGTCSPALGSKTYCVTNTGSNWQEAQNFAFSQGGRLARISSEQENTVVAGLLSGKVTAWLGGSTNYTGTPNPTFTWAPDNLMNATLTELLNPSSWATYGAAQPIAYSNWATTSGGQSLEPNFYEGVGRYGIAMWGTAASYPAGTWHDQPTRNSLWNGSPINAVIEFDQNAEPTLGQLMVMATAAATTASQGTPSLNNLASLQTWGTTFAGSWLTNSGGYNFASTLGALSALGASQGLLQQSVAQLGLPPETTALLAGLLNSTSTGAGGTSTPVTSFAAPGGGNLTAVPTPALLPGLVGFFWQVKRKRAKREAVA